MLLVAGAGSRETEPDRDGKGRREAPSDGSGGVVSPAGREPFAVPGGDDAGGRPPPIRRARSRHAADPVQKAALDRLVAKGPPAPHFLLPMAMVEDEALRSRRYGYVMPLREPRFRRSFTDGLHYPSRRVRESEWRKAFFGAIDSVWPCTCNAEDFHEPGHESGVAAQPEGKCCWSCGKPLVLPSRIRIGDGDAAREAVVLLNRPTRLFGRHLGRSSDGDTPTAEVVPALVRFLTPC